MKKFWIVALVAMAIMLTGQITWAAVTGTAHDVAGISTAYAKFGVCSACHVPHKALGKRLWPALLTTDAVQLAARGEVGAMCSYCHDGVGGQIVSARQPLVFKDVTPFTHGLTKANLPTGDDVTASGLPYVTGTATRIECASCHNVHDDTLKPFLQADIDTLCAKCHLNRQFVGHAASSAQGAWGNFYGWNTVGANGNPGAHPVGTDVFADTSGAGNSPITTGIIGILAYGATFSHNLGPHLIDGGVTFVSGSGVGCITCHATHGTQSEGGSTIGPFEDLLSLSQGSAGGRATGAGQPNDALCEACHRGKVPGFAGGATIFPNPGATARYTHPVDDYVDMDLGVTAFPANWPIGAGTGNTPYDICESCHTPHSLTGMPNGVIVSGTNTHILRAPELTVCDRCHVGTLANHHPTGVSLDGTRFADAAIDVNGDGVLQCADCHFGSGAHNWTGPGAVGLNPNWEPPDNGRASDTGPTVIIQNTSKECLDCHTAGGTHFSPTRRTAGGYGGHSASLENSGEGSHHIGQISAAWTLGRAGVNLGFCTSNWLTGTNVWSRRGSDAVNNNMLVCESCHDLQRSKNQGNNALLMWQFRDNTLAVAQSDLCEGCHSHNATTTGNPHPMTGDTVTKAQLNNLAPIILQTSGPPRYANAAPTAYATYPGANQMDCDSCHQVHQTDTDGGTYILETNAAGTAITGTPDTNIIANGYTFANVAWSANGGMNYTVFCGLCHLSGF